MKENASLFKPEGSTVSNVVLKKILPFMIDRNPAKEDELDSSQYFAKKTRYNEELKQRSKEKHDLIDEIGKSENSAEMIEIYEDQLKNVRSQIAMIEILSSILDSRNKKNSIDFKVNELKQLEV